MTWKLQEEVAIFLETGRIFLRAFINWVAGAQGTSTDSPSKIRMVLFEGDKLNFSNISKIKFNAVPEKVQMSNELGIGEYVVGRDVKAGTYRLSTNINMNSELQNLGWSLSIYNMLTKTSKNQTLDPSNLDVAETRRGRNCLDQFI